MRSPSEADFRAVLAPQFIASGDFERRLAEVQAAAAGPVEGLLGPHSITWRLDREAALFLGAGRALLLQLAHPWVAAAIADHSRALADPIGRFHRTFSIVFTMVFGTVDQAMDAARRLHRRHAAIRGVMPEDAGAFAQGSTYRANEVAALQWVHSTLVSSGLMAYEMLLPPLSPQEREQYYAESRLVGALFGIPADHQPADWRAFTAYTEAMLHSNVLSVSAAGRAIANAVLGGAGTRWLKTPTWYLALTAELLPSHLRAGFGLAYGEAERRRAAQALRWLRRTYPLLPERLRLVGPYQEARGRLSGRSVPDAATRALNRLWMGRPRMGSNDAGRCPPAGPVSMGDHG
jgi:uncharacterized protein (DUF2236 family)